MRGSVKTAGSAALAALVLCASQPAAQARDGLGVGGAVALGALGGVVAGTAIASANTFGDCRATLATTMAAFVAISPCPASLAGLTSTRASTASGTSGTTLRTTSTTASRTRA